jgi:hypothetical protein
MEPGGEASISRTRYVEVDWSALDGSGGPPGNQSGAGNRLKLELFEDASLTAVLDRAEARPPDMLIWGGHVEGVAGSQVGLVIEGERLRNGQQKAISAPPLRIWPRCACT